MQEQVGGIQGLGQGFLVPAAQVSEPEELEVGYGLLGVGEKKRGVGPLEKRGGRWILGEEVNDEAEI